MRITQLAAAAAAIASIAVALFSLRYLVPSWPIAPPIVAANPFAHPWLPLHAVCAALALLLGPLQFLTVRGGARRSWHRLTGRVYVASCLVGAVTALPLALGATTGPVSTAGFGTLAVVWFAVNALGWKAALDRRFADHRRWMVRSFALTFGAVLLRLYLPVGPLLGFTFEDSYRLISFLAWVPNLIAVEIYLSRRPIPALARPDLA